tara:strand:+ start:254 stop:796 length:543 start_codon:yes stop_codon:yes gene_type:complete
MNFKNLSINGAYIIEPNAFSDDRGVFRRAFCSDTFKNEGLSKTLAQANISENFKKHTLRGFHYQIEPHSEAKTLTCVSGSVYDIIVDLRPSSSTYLNWEAVNLTRENKCSLHVPKGCANSFLTLEDNTTMVYFSSNNYNPDYEKGIRYNDPLFKFKWPIKKPKFISNKDSSWADFKKNNN